MNTEQPMKTISCLITCYNSEPTIARAINSVLTQFGFFRLEIIVVDDGSTDNSQQTIERFGSGGGRIKTFFRKHEGLIKTFVFGLKQCSGEYICFCDSDDYYLPGAIQTRLEFMEKHPEIGLCGTLYQTENPYTRTITNKVFKDNIIPARAVSFDGILRGYLYFTETTYFVRRSLIEDFVNKRLSKFFIQDVPILLHVAHHSKIAIIQKVTAGNRIRIGSHSRPKSVTDARKYQWNLYKTKLYFLFHYQLRFSTLCRSTWEIIITNIFLPIPTLVITYVKPDTLIIKIVRPYKTLNQNFLQETPKGKNRPLLRPHVI